ncbi:MAG: hypothetical protein GF417_10160 [Candidatus Latescibacteria bacterium]|nr:hypothetical protein [bacterium]MBD3424790.1 hypothetical protein [Candidatus Latescibacterota bacterium]
MGSNLETGESRRRIELVPLIDVIFLLLIFFLVTLNISAALGGSEDLEGTYGIEMMDSRHKAGGKALIAVLPVGSGGLSRTCYLQMSGAANSHSPDLDFEGLSGEIERILKGGGSIQSKIDDIRMRLDYFLVESGLYQNPEHLAESLRRNNPDRAVILCGGGERFSSVHRVIRVCRKEGVSRHEVITMDSIDQLLHRLSMVNLDLEGRVIRKDG